MNEPEERTAWERFWLVLLYIFGVAVAGAIITGLYLLAHQMSGLGSL